MSAFVAAVAPGQAAATTTGTTYYVDCDSGKDSAKGLSPQTAWRSLERVNSVVFKPGDSILFRRGTTCEGVLKPQGSGTTRDPIVIGAYGSGALPAINGGGARATVFLYNVQGWEIRDLDISNPATRDGNARAGIYVLLENFGTGKGYTVKNVKIHDVPGCDCLQPELENSGGVIFKAAGSEVPTGFDGITITRNTISGVDNTGIGVVSQWSKRDLYPAGTNSFVGIPRVNVSWNKLTDMGGDGILVMNGIDSVMEYNTVEGFGLRASASHAAIVSFNSDGSVAQYNEISGGSDTPPSFALSVDAGNRDLVYQYNYSHDNDGPFILFCAFVGSYAENATIRYNVSQNDQDLLLGDFEVPVVANGCDNGITNVKFYNNVIYSPTADVIVGSRGDHTPIEFANNIFYGKPGGSEIHDAVGVYDHNLYHNVVVPSHHANPVLGDPKFVSAGSSYGVLSALGYRLRCGSPAIGAGIAIPDNGGHDLYGNPVPATRPNIGVHQGSCVN
ncbi:hypothetical protein ITP53_35390 [Nonomuraea sp. K274]|uniref:Right handed beta helix domain-containing protein n=1 Tax=Nonomuraea cypriaca TaxID=1187855 RepID=A0A931AIR1_9ACTN|nr:right-handed parallel beta-helix repeat-containing protein [Nonomuraea cypriaca]MBF8190900.1 hypothetical protein [Nonomuraea cypriaca]